MLRLSSIFGLSEPARTYCGTSRRSNLTALTFWLPTSGPGPTRQPPPSRHQFNFRRIRVYSRHSSHVMPRGISVSKTKLDSFTPHSEMQVPSHRASHRQECLPSSRQLLLLPV